MNSQQRKYSSRTGVQKRLRPQKYAKIAIASTVIHRLIIPVTVKVQLAESSSGVINAGSDLHGAPERVYPLIVAGNVLVSVGTERKIRGSISR